MVTRLKNAMLYTNGGFNVGDVFIGDGHISDVPPLGFPISETLNAEDLIILPGFVDVHSHLREPGFFYKETIKSGTFAAAAGGFTTVCSMPNLNPSPDTQKNLQVQLDIIKRDAVIDVIPYGCITKGEKGEELSDMEDLAPYVCAFSDDGKGVQNSARMKEAMLKAKALNKTIVAHCEDESLLFGGYIHKGAYAKEHGHAGICSESEWKQVERDLHLVEETRVKYHICHVSTKETVELVREAKKKGLSVTCETAPHYIALTDDDLREDGRYKMNPPLRTAEDKRALIEGLCDGTIDMIATDHAPHSAEEKAKGLAGSCFGISGFETAFSVVNTYLVKTGIITLEKLVEIMSINPRKLFGIKGGTENGDAVVVNLNEKRKIIGAEFLSMGKSTPFDGMTLYGTNIMTIKNGRIAWRKR